MTIRMKLEKAEAAKAKARDAVYAAAHPRRDIPFSECLAMADEKTRARFNAARDRVDDLEAQAIREGKAWRGQLGSLHFYR